LVCLNLLLAVSNRRTAKSRRSVGTHYYEVSGRVAEARGSRRVPWLQMRGDWLAAAGFDIQAPVRVRVMQGCLVVTVEES